MSVRSWFEVVDQFVKGSMTSGRSALEMGFRMLEMHSSDATTSPYDKVRLERHQP